MALLGLRGSGSFGTPGGTDERPKNWREMILLMFPNGEAPLTAFLSKLSDESTDDPEFNWWEKGLPSQRTLVNNGAGYAAGDTSIVVDDGSIFKKNHVILVERTNEIIFTSADPAGNTLTVVRGKGEIVAAAIVDNDPLLIIGSIYEEGAKGISVVSYAPTKQFNYTQIFRTPLYLTRTAKKTRLRYDKTGPYREAKREALQLHSIEMEKAFLFGQRKEEIGPDGQPRRLTRGFYTWIVTNKLTDINANGIWGDRDFTVLWENMFRYGSSEKFVLAGSTALSTLTEWAKNKSTINMAPKDQTYGMKINHIITPFGDLYIKNHPLLSDHPTYRSHMIAIDTDKVKYRYVDDTHYKKNTQAQDEDASKDEYLTESGLEVWHEKAHTWVQTMNSYSPTE
jgi:hypothetical protein